MTIEDWRAQLAAARDPDPELKSRQDAWDVDWVPINEQGLRSGMSPGRAALRAMRLTEARRGSRPEPKEASS